MPSVPSAVFVIGPAGSGKSTVARQLAATLHAVYLDKDTVAGSFVRHAMRCAGEDPDVRESNQHYRTVLMPLEYRAVFDIARDNLRLMRTVVIDAPFAGYLEDPAYLTARRQESAWPPEARAIVARVVADPQVILERVIVRGSERDRWKRDHWDEFWTRFGDTGCVWTDAEIVTVRNDGEADLHEVLAAIGT